MVHQIRQGATGVFAADDGAGGLEQGRQATAHLSAREGGEKGGALPLRYEGDNNGEEKRQAEQR